MSMLSTATVRPAGTSAPRCTTRRRERTALLRAPAGEQDRVDYRQALRFSEAACQLESKNAHYLTTLGMAHYRLGNDDKALETLLRADQIEEPESEGPIPAQLAFLAMTRHRLGQAQEAPGRSRASA